MKRTRIQAVSLRNRLVMKDGEGVPVISWGEAVQMRAEVWPAGGQLQMQMYGDKVNDMKNVRIEGAFSIVPEAKHLAFVFRDFTLREGDGLCIYVDASEAPDYRIRSITPYHPLKMEVERI